MEKHESLTLSPIAAVYTHCEIITSSPAIMGKPIHYDACIVILLGFISITPHTTISVIHSKRQTNGVPTHLKVSVQSYYRMLLRHILIFCMITI